MYGQIISASSTFCPYRKLLHIGGGMQSKNKRTTQAEREHVERIKALHCVVCGTPGPSIAHHVKQDSHFHAVPLCEDCHTGPHNGIHGQRAMWKVMKMDEVDALAKTIEALCLN